MILKCKKVLIQILNLDFFVNIKKAGVYAFKLKNCIQLKSIDFLVLNCFKKNFIVAYLNVQFIVCFFLFCGIE